MNITKGIQPRPVRAVIYGPEGIGKCTLAAGFPAPLFVDLEGGTARLDVARVAPLSFAAVKGIVAELAKGSEYKTVVFDTADWLERQLSEALLAEHNWRSIETPGYGKGYAMLAEDWRKFLDAVAAMQDATGMHVVFCAHAWLRKQELPDEAGSFDRWEMKLTKHVGPALKEWCDLILFANYQTLVVQIEGGKAKAQGQERVLYTTHHACWDAKNRFGLADRLPMEIKALAGVFAVSGAAPKAPEPKAAEPKPAPAAEPKPITETAAQALDAVPAEQRTDPEKQDLLRQLGQLMLGDRVSKEMLGAELHRKGITPEGMNPREYNAATLRRVIAGWQAVLGNIQKHQSEAWQASRQAA